MIRNFLLSSVVGIFCITGSGISLADSSSSETSHLQVINSELDQIEAYLNYETPPTKVVAVPPITVNMPVRPVTQPTVVEAAGPRPFLGLSPRKDELEFSPEFYWSKFRETGAYSQKGFMAGYDVNYTHRFNNQTRIPINMVGLQAQWAGGKFKQPSDDVGFSGVRDSAFDFRALVGKDFHPWTRIRTTGYIGYGFRYLKDKAGGQDSIVDGTEYLGDKTASHYSYLPIGMDFVYQTDPRYGLQANLEYDYLITGWQVNKLGDAFSSLDTLTLRQNDGFGLRASVRFNWYLKYCTAFTEWYWRYWNIAQSNSRADAGDPTLTPLYEAKNTTSEVGFRLGLDI